MYSEAQRILSIVWEVESLAGMETASHSLFVHCDLIHNGDIAPQNWVSIFTVNAFVALWHN